MRFTTKLFRGSQPVIVNGAPLCLGHLILMIHGAAKSNMDDWQQLIDLADQVFEKIDGATPADAILPAFDRAFHYRFTGIGAWGAGNVNGMLEMLFQGDCFLQAGVQVSISRVKLFGSKRSVSNVISELTSTVEAIYSQSLSTPVDTGNGAFTQISDNASLCYLSVMPTDPPIITCRIGNRAIWDHVESHFGT